MIKRSLIAALCVLSPFTTAHASTVERKSLKEVVAMSDHVVLGKVVEIDLIDSRGNVEKDGKTRVGLGSAYLVRLHVQVQASGVLRSNKAPFPSKIIITTKAPTRSTLESWRDLLKEKERVFLLKGDTFQPAYPLLYQRRVTELAAIKAALK